MKKLKLLNLVTVAVMLWYCSGPIPDPVSVTPDPPKEEAAYVQLSTGQSSAVSVGYEKKEMTFSFSTNKNWTVELSYGSGTASWLTLNTKNGTPGNQTIIATISENLGETSRSAVVTIKAGNASANITISQDAFKSEFSIQQKVIEVEAAGGTIEVSVTSNIGYHATSSVDWIHAMETKATQTKSLWFIADANTSSEPRSGVIVICNDNDVCIPVTVNQAAGKASLSISVSSMEFGYEGGENQVTVTSNADWTSECSADWCYVTPSSESGDCDVKVVVNANTEKKSRSTTVTFKTEESHKTLTISQKPFEAVFEISPKKQAVDADGGTVTVTVTSNIGYHATSSVDWIHELGTKADLGGTHMFRIDKNESLQKRTGAIVFCNDENVCVPVEIEQDGAAALISISPGILEFSSSSGEKTVDITSNTNWTVSQKPQWCTLSPNSATGNATVSVSVTENGNTFTREGKIVFSAGSATAELSVRQQPGEPELEVSDTEFSFSGNGDVASFTITSNAGWVVNTGASWLKASEESGTGNAAVTLTAERNEKLEVRTTQVTVRTKDGTIRRTITVSQAEGEPYLDLNVYTLNFGPQEGQAEVSVSSNVSWGFTSSDSWCTIKRNATANSFSVFVKANDSGKNRSAQITVRTDKGGLEKTVTVSQSTPDDNEGFDNDGEIIWD